MSIETKDALTSLNHKLMVQPVIIEDLYDSENSRMWNDQDEIIYTLRKLLATPL